MGEIWKATLLMYWDCMRLATQGMRRNWPILVGSVGLFFAYALSMRLLSNFGFAGGMVAGLVQVALLSMYYSWISDTVQKERLRFNDLAQFDYGLFFNVISVAFIIFIAQFVIQQFTQGLDAAFFILCVQLAIVLIFNAIPEVIHLHRVESLFALSEAARFTRENWIEWYLPLLVIIAPWLLFNPLSVLYTLAQSDPLLPPFIIIKGYSFIGAYSSHAVSYFLPLVGIILANWFMLFRAYLFKALESGSRRNRVFQSKRR